MRDIRFLKQSSTFALAFFISISLLVAGVVGIRVKAWAQTSESQFQDTQRILEIQNQFNLATSFYNQKSYQISIPHFIKTLELDNKHFQARYFLALAFFKTGKNQEAIRELENLIRIHGQNRNIAGIINFFLQQQYVEPNQELVNEYVWIRDYPNPVALEASPLQKFNPLNLIRKESYQIRTPISLRINSYNELEVLDFSLKEFFKLDGDGIYRGDLYDKNSFFGGNESLAGPWDFEQVGENIWVSDLLNDNIKVINPGGSIIAVYGTKGVGATNLLGPRGMAQDENGNVYVVDSGNGRIAFFNREGVWLKNIAERGEGSQNLLKPVDVAYDTERRRIYVLDNANKSIQIYSPEEEYLGRISDRAFNDPRKLHLAYDRNNRSRFLYILDREQLFRFHLNENSLNAIPLRRDRINKSTATIAPAEFMSLAIGKDQYLYLGNTLRQKIEVFAPVEKTYVNLPVLVSGVNTKQFPLVKLDVSVKNLTGHPVAFLKSHNFSLYENNVAIPFTLTTNPAVNRIVWLVEKSALSRERSLSIKTFGYDLFDNLGARDTVKLITYNERGFNEETPFNSYKLATTEKALTDNYTPNFNASAGLIASLNHIGDQRFKNAIVLLAFTPHEAKHFKTKYIDVLQAVKNQDVPVYVFYAGANTSSERQLFMLRSLSEQTGAKFYIYNREAMAQFKTDLANYHNGVYHLEYITSPNPYKKGSFRKVAVNVRYKNNQGEDQLAGYPIPY